MRKRSEGPADALAPFRVSSPSRHNICISLYIYIYICVRPTGGNECVPYGIHTRGRVKPHGATLCVVYPIELGLESTWAARAHTCTHTHIYMFTCITLPFSHDSVVLSADHLVSQFTPRLPFFRSFFSGPVLAHPPPPPGPGKCQELGSRFQVRFPRIDFHCQWARFFLLALIIILTLYSHGYPRSGARTLPCPVLGHALEVLVVEAVLGWDTARWLVLEHARQQLEADLVQVRADGRERHRLELGPVVLFRKGTRVVWALWADPSFPVTKLKGQC